MSIVSKALALALCSCASSTPAPVVTCTAPVAVVVKPGIAANSTFYSDGEPPKRFAKVPSKPVQVVFGQSAVNDFCGVPPCGLRFLGCARGDKIAILSPFVLSSEEFARVLRHELGHLQGWPATHGQ